MVAAAQIDDGPVGSPARHVAGAIQALARMVRVRDEAVLCQVGPVQIAARQLHPAQMQIAPHAGRHGAQPLVQNDQPRVPHRPADGHGAGRILRPAGPIADVHRRLGRAVEVVQFGAHRLVEAVAQFGGQLFTAAEDVGDRDPLRRRIGQKGRQHGGDEVQVGDRMAADQPGDGRRIAVRAGRGHDQFAARNQGEEELPHRHVEGGGRLLKDSRLGADAVFGLHPQQAVDDGPMLDQHPLGIAGRTRGVDDIGSVLALLRHHWRRPVQRPVGGRQQGLAEHAADVFMSQHDARSGGADDGGDALGRMLQIQRQIGPARA
ncbi:hypothetical protein D3C73_576090 [compost metagenome]